MDRKGTIIIISAFSGAGKGTIVKELVKDPKNVLSVSATSRAMRAEDIDGVTYSFKTRKEFESMIRNDEFIEWTEYCENYYGTPKGYIEEKLEEGKNVVLEIEVVGALNAKKIYDEAVLIYILPPSIEELKKRLINRGEEEEVINKRLCRAIEEVKLIHNYDYVVINDKIENAVEEMKNIIEVSKKKASRNEKIIEKLKEELKEC